ncbi:hypothetical protein [Sphingomonas kyungheensis]|uniref:Uncharacterized protein n=1 Tax=Sphingomonas kyungheensis TaxID=1069987 RepID=A0ABU8H274_9SPHN
MRPSRLILEGLDFVVATPHQSIVGVVALLSIMAAHSDRLWHMRWGNMLPVL